MAPPTSDVRLQTWGGRPVRCRISLHGTRLPANPHGGSLPAGLDTQPTIREGPVYMPVSQGWSVAWRPSGGVLPSRPTGGRQSRPTMPSQSHPNSPSNFTVPSHPAPPSHPILPSRPLRPSQSHPVIPASTPNATDDYKLRHQNRQSSQARPLGMSYHGSLQDLPCPPMAPGRTRNTPPGMREVSTRDGRKYRITCDVPICRHTPCNAPHCDLPPGGYPPPQAPPRRHRSQPISGLGAGRRSVCYKYIRVDLCA